VFLKSLLLLLRRSLLAWEVLLVLKKISSMKIGRGGRGRITIFCSAGSELVADELSSEESASELFPVQRISEISFELSK